MPALTYTAVVISWRHGEFSSSFSTLKEGDMDYENIWYSSVKLLSLRCDSD